MNNSIIGYFNEGDEIKVIAENATEGWYKVEFVAYGGETKTGYIASNAKYFVETQDETTAATDSAATESAPAQTTSEAEK